MSKITLCWPLCLGALCAASLTACPDDSEPPPAAPYVVDNACTRGGAASLGGSSMLVQPGSLPGDQPLCLVSASNTAIPAPTGIYLSQRDIIGLTPYGARLEAPIRLSLPVNVGAPLVVLRADGPQATSWEVLRDFSMRGAELSLSTEKTGVFVIGQEFGRPPCEVTNRCGGCTILEAQPGSPCGPCGLDLVACLGPDQLTCTGETTNACGGCGFLPAQPGDACGACGLDEWTCQSLDQVACLENTTNACGGCDELDGAPGDPCGPCGLDRLVCRDGGLACDGATESNACGACAPLPGVPGEPCGACADGLWACDGAELACQGATEGNACGGCGPLEGALGDRCGACGDGFLGCREGALVCQQDAQICADERAYVAVEPGVFVFGAPAEEPGRGVGELAPVELSIAWRFLLQATEVTQAQWDELMESNPSAQEGCPACPVENMSFFAALEYLNRLSAAEGRAPCYVCASGAEEQERPCGELEGLEATRLVRFEGIECEGYRLPLEVEWEYAARAGTQTPWSCGEEASCLPSTAVCGEALRAFPVSVLEPNAWGLYDMHGNVAEFVWGAAEENPAGSPYAWQEAHSGILRGGAFSDEPAACRSAARLLLDPSSWDTRWQGWGLRAARTLPLE